MFAVVKTGGRQYKVTPGQKIRVESRRDDVGAKVTLDEVLLVLDGENVKIGTPTVGGAKIEATVLSQGRAEKIRVFKMRRRKNYRKTQGHRQSFTELQIDKISF